jgi:2-keto-4-pentenoate hydratase/2-oxohepta-3-ene-1,7-dioic acid hydratase in catechol pathway
MCKSWMPELAFDLPDGAAATVTVTRLLNAGYAGREQDEVAAHVAELAELGIPAPEVTPALYPVAPYLAAQADTVPVQHGRTSGEAEWALVVAGPHPEDLLLTVACDHTDRALEVHGVAWSKNAGLDVLGSAAWRLVDVEDHLDELRLRAWVTHEGDPEQLIQDAPLAALLPPRYWLDELAQLLEPGTVLLSGTVAMLPGVDQFAERWRVELADPVTGHTLGLAYAVERMPAPIG